MTNEFKAVKAPERSKKNSPRGKYRTLAQAAMTLQAGQAIEVAQGANLALLLMGLSVGSGRTFRSYKAKDGKMYVTVD